MSPGPSFSVEFDRSIARARITGNERLAEHLERIRPRLNLDKGNDRSEVFASASVAFARDLVEVGRELRADPFDMILIMAGICCHMLNILRETGLDYMMASHALTKHIDDIAGRVLEAAQAKAEADGG